MARDILHRLVDELPEEEVGTATHVLAALSVTDPVRRSLLEAPEDEEPETAEERAAVAEAWDEHRRGEGLTTEELRHRLGLGPAR